MTPERISKFDLEPTNRWKWQHDKPDPEVIGKNCAVLSTRALRVIGKSAINVYAALERERGFENRSISIPLALLASRSRIAYKTVKDALARLRKCGLIESSWHHDFVKIPAGYMQWRTVTRHNVAGAWQKIDGVLTILAPPKTHEWAAQRRLEGRPKQQKTVDNFRLITASCAVDAITDFQLLNPKLPPTAPPKKADFEAPGKVAVTRLQVLNSKLPPLLILVSNTDPNSDPSFTYVKDAGSGEPSPVNSKSRIDSLRSSESKITFKPNPIEKRNVAFAILRKPPEREKENQHESESANSDDLTKLLARLDKIMFAENHQPLRASYGPPPVAPPLDQPQRINFGPVPISKLLPESAYADHLVDAYNSALFDVYGVRRQRWGDIAKTTVYQRLKAAGRVLMEEGIPARRWAEWTLGRFKKLGKKAPPVGMVFAAGAIERWHGWYRKEHDGGGSYKLDIKRVHYEQLYRRQEAWARWRGQKDPFHRWPAWYGDMRREEIKMGMSDPLALYPKVMPK